jgi:hypothetical protein
LMASFGTPGFFAAMASAKLPPAISRTVRIGPHHGLRRSEATEDQ